MAVGGVEAKPLGPNVSMVQFQSWHKRTSTDDLFVATTEVSLCFGHRVSFTLQEGMRAAGVVSQVGDKLGRGWNTITCIGSTQGVW